ncbi:hypothetical protein M5K25_028240 [Dendrobium thyrsiflorum]|uniref:Uncharacterized protein n=1 Tax=Dendrobium thyrsiflorum TaxID=117978 RepID=A0ABD0TTY0_DENTH
MLPGAGLPRFAPAAFSPDGNSVVYLDSRRVTRSTVPRCEVQVVMITPRYALAPLTGTPGPANARENPVSQCPRLFQIEGSWRPGTMTSSSSISLRARDFYAAGRDSRLCVEKKRQLKQI